MTGGLTFGSLFAGIGGIDLGLKAHGLRPVWHSEIEPTSSAVLAEHWPGIPNHGDITAIDWRKVEPVDVIAGGFPCQDISFAGRGAGLSGKKSGLWVEMAGAVRALRPRFVFVENVGGLRRRGLGTVLGDLAALGYDVTWSCLRASDVGAPHRRERIFIVASDADDQRRYRGTGNERTSGGWDEPTNGGNAISDAGSLGRDRWPSGVETRGTTPEWHEEGGNTGDGRSTPVVSDPDVDRRQELERVQSGLGPWGDADGRGATPTDPDYERRERRSELNDQPKQPDKQASLGNDPLGLGPAREWGQYAPAIERWERLTRPAPAAVDEKGRLAAPFVEWLMGFPDGWTLAAGTRPARLRALGNAVVPHCAARAWAVLAPEIVAAQAEYEASA